MASQITATLPTLNFPKEVDYPTQEDWAAFSAAAELNFGVLGGSWSTQMQLWKTQANAMSTELNTNANIAQSTVNYKGDWTSQGYALNESVSVSGIYYICKLTHATGQNPTAVGSIYWNLAIGNWNLKVDTNMSGYTSKTTPVDADLIPLSDSTSSFSLKKLTWANIKANILNALNGLSAKTTPVDADILLVGDSVSSFSSKKLTFANLKGTIFTNSNLTGTPTAPTQTVGDNSTKVATTAYVDGKMVLSTAVTATGTSIDFTNIPSWAKKITVMLSGVSLSGVAHLLIKLGTSGGIVSSGYTSTSGGFNASGQDTSSSTTGLIVFLAGATRTSTELLTLIKLTNNTWVSSHSGKHSASDVNAGGGNVTLPSTLDRVRITTVNGTDTFDAGSINIMYEG